MSLEPGQAACSLDMSVPCNHLDPERRTVPLINPGGGVYIDWGVEGDSKERHPLSLSPILCQEVRTGLSKMDRCRIGTALFFKWLHPSLSLGGNFIL